MNASLMAEHLADAEKQQALLTDQREAKNPEEKRSLERKRLEGRLVFEEECKTVGAATEIRDSVGSEGEIRGKWASDLISTRFQGR